MNFYVFFQAYFQACSSQKYFCPHPESSDLCFLYLLSPVILSFSPFCWVTNTGPLFLNVSSATGELRCSDVWEFVSVFSVYHVWRRLASIDTNNTEFKHCKLKRVNIFYSSKLCLLLDLLPRI